jgi:hypothetical protein
MGDDAIRYMRVGCITDIPFRTVSEVDMIPVDFTRWGFHDI